MWFVTQEQHDEPGSSGSFGEFATMHEQRAVQRGEAALEGGQHARARPAPVEELRQREQRERGPARQCRQPRSILSFVYKQSIS